MIDRLEKEVDMLERHLQVLKMVIENEPIGIVKMSNETGYPHHKVRYSLRVLEEENLIEPSSQGAIKTERTVEFVDELDGKLDEIVEKLDGMKIEDVAEIEGLSRVRFGRRRPTPQPPAGASPTNYTSSRRFCRTAATIANPSSQSVAAPRATAADLVDQ